MQTQSRNLIKQGAQLAVVLTLLSCASAISPRSTASTPAQASSKLLFLHSSNQGLELEPCGCTLVQMGGIDRAFNAIEKMRQGRLSSSAVFFSGSTFVPSEGRMSAHFLKLKRSALAEAIQLLGAAAVAPSGEDASLGIDELQRLSALSGVPFLSANLARQDGSLVFPAAHRFSIGGLQITVLGFSGKDSARHPVGKGLRLLPLADAAKAAVQAIAPSDAVVVLASVGEKERSVLIRELGVANIYFGATAADYPTGTATRAAPSTLYMNTEARGRALGWVEIDAKKVTRFFNPELAEYQRMFLASVQAKVDGLRASKSKRSRGALAAAESELVAQSAFPSEPSPEWTLYDSGTIQMTPEYATPANELTKRIQLFKSQTRELALQGG